MSIAKEPDQGKPAPARNGYKINVKPDQRFTHGRCCPVCKGDEDARRGQGERCYGFVSEDGQWCHCTRVEHAGRSPLNPGSQAYVHKLRGACPCGTEHAPADPKPRKGTGGLIETTYPYYNRLGDLLFEVVRFKPKSFRQRRAKPGGGFAWGLGGLKPVLYRLPELTEADPAAVVFVAEGERDVDRLHALGLVATCNPMGAGKWRDHYAADLAGRSVVILPDNDAPGRDHAEHVARSLHGTAATVKVIDLPGLPDKGDVSDWLDAGGTVDALAALARDAPEWSPPAEPEPAPGADDRALAALPRTDLGNAERLVARHGRDLRYCHPWKKWLAWDGCRWRLDDTGEVRRRARLTARAILAEALTLDDDDRRKALALWGLTTQTAGRLTSMVYLAEVEDGIPVLPAALDLDPWALNVRNGTLDLTTGALRPHRREDMITRLCPVAYDAAAACPLWLATLHLVFAGNLDLIGFWQRLCGLALTGTVTEQILPILHGTGSNGKSTILNLLLQLLGPDYAAKAPPELLTVKRNESHPTERAALFGKRLVVAIETGEGSSINESMIKELTGSDIISARRMREDFWDFSPTHKLMLCTNHKPVVRGTDHALWRRLKLVPFDVRIPDDRADRDMPAKLLGELPGILAWCVRGCLEWQRGGLTPPAEVREATEGYRRDEDVIGAFLTENCVLDPSCRAKATPLYERYRLASERAGETPVNQRKFGRALTERGFTRTTNDGTWYEGIGLRPESV